MSIYIQIQKNNIAVANIKIKAYRATMPSKLKCVDLGLNRMSKL